MGIWASEEIAIRIKELGEAEVGIRALGEIVAREAAIREEVAETRVSGEAILEEAIMEIRRSNKTVTRAEKPALLFLPTYLSLLTFWPLCKLFWLLINASNIFSLFSVFFSIFDNLLLYLYYLSLQS